MAFLYENWPGFNNWYANQATPNTSSGLDQGTRNLLAARRAADAAGVNANLPQNNTPYPRITPTAEAPALAGSLFSGALRGLGGAGLMAYPSPMGAGTLYNQQGVMSGGGKYPTGFVPLESPGPPPPPQNLTPPQPAQNDTGFLSSLGNLFNFGGGNSAQGKNPPNEATLLPMLNPGSQMPNLSASRYSAMPNPVTTGMGVETTRVDPNSMAAQQYWANKLGGPSGSVGGSSQQLYQRKYDTPYGTASGMTSVPPGQGSFNTLGLGLGDTAKTVEALNQKTAALRSLREAQNPGITQGGMGGYEPPAPPSLQDSISAAYGGARNADFLFRTDMAGAGNKKKQGIMAGILADYQGKQQSYNDQLGLAGKQQDVNAQMARYAAQQGLDWAKLSLDQQKQLMDQAKLPMQQNLLQAQALGALPKPQQMIAAKYIQAYNAGNMAEAQKYLDQLTALNKTGDKTNDLQEILNKAMATQPTQ